MSPKTYLLNEQRPTTRTAEQSEWRANMKWKMSPGKARHELSRKLAKIVHEMELRAVEKKDRPKKKVHGEG
ncbi:hypothetical protein PRIPAC_70269 [Pristionchus pacificus]|uniref:Uncharacterized protein n=1 Tax=Pristionchus pacificus TaxID=54126 RepID=A0A2A6CFW3_PRIPA|nr:hypothetical protein PRIPAC_70269 [Pristionchus pacificus]|eukprot:PDM76996.1 hypothetical protein PRIPAC_42391 [Pristionchus pacificus]